MNAATTPPTSEPPTRQRLIAAATPILRDITRGGIASAVGGLVVGGLGGRLVMRIAALLSPDAAGSLTENGELIGAITFQGTTALMVFGGLLVGLGVGVVWVVISPWLPGRGWRRWLVAMPVAVGVGGSLLVRSDNRDFEILGSDGAVVLLLLVLVAVMGGAIAWLDDWLDRRLPRPGTDPFPRFAVYFAVALIGGLLFVPLAIQAYFGNTSSPYPPDRVGGALIAVGVVTVVAWVMRIASGAAEPPTVVRTAGRIALVAAVVIGFAHLLPEIGRIVPPE